MHAYKKAFIELNVKLPTKIIFWVLKEIQPYAKYHQYITHGLKNEF